MAGRGPLPRRGRVYPIWTKLVVVAGLVLASAVAVPASASARGTGDRDIRVDVLSSAPERVTGGDAMIRVRVGDRIRLSDVHVRRNGVDVTSSLTPDTAAGQLVGVVTGLVLGRNTIVAYDLAGHVGALSLRNHPISGPVFSGPQQYPFLCRTEQAGLGQPIVDNQDAQGLRVFALNPDGTKSTTVVGWSRDCAAPTVVDYLYRASNNQFRPLPADGSRPADLVTTTTLDGQVVDYVVRRERGTIDRFLYSIAMLAPLSEAAAGTGLSDPDDSAWNRRTIFWFDGGVAIGHDQGRIPSNALYHNGLSLGYAVITSSGNRTNTHYNLILGGENALMVKERFIEGHGVPRYTVGIGGSGGAIQQYVYGQNHGTGVIDAGIAQYSYSDMVTQTIHISDCELLEYYMDVTDGANPKWQNWDNRTWLIGLNASPTVANPYRGGAPGSTECVAGWRGLTPLANNPLWPGTQLDPLWAQMDPPGVAQIVQWTHWADLVNIYGVGADGYARSTFDNVGVQYGLKALVDGHITPAEFLDLNANVGGWLPPAQMVQEGCPFTPAACADPAQFDPWSARNMQRSPDGGVTPAARTRGSREAIAAAYRSGLVFHGDIDIPVIDWRHYLEDRLDMHNSHQSFATRQRMRDWDGRAGNQVIWFTDARPAPVFDQTPEALGVIDQWMANIAANPRRGAAGNRPALATDRCFTTAGVEIAAGPGVWDGILDDRPDGACTQQFPLYGTSRTVAGGPIEGSIYACTRQSVEQAIARGLYGSWSPDVTQLTRLKEIFPNGVCDYSRPDAARPRHL
jgi:hypothetical protein